MRAATLVITSILAALSQELLASTIQDVRVLPTCAINPHDRVMLEVFVSFPTTPPYLFKPTQVERLDNYIVVDLFATSGVLDMHSSRMLSIDLGSYPAGQYSFTIREHDLWRPEVPEYNGTFEVTLKRCDELLRNPRHLYWADYRGIIRLCSPDGLKVEGLIDDVNPTAFT